MAGIQTSTGLISGVAITDTVDKLIAVSAQPRDRLQAKTKTLQDQQLAVGQLTALVIGVQLSSDPLGKSKVFDQTKISSSAPAISASISGTAKPGRYQIVPVQQSQQQQYTSTLLASSDQLVGAGELTVNAGGFLDSTLSLDELNGGVGVSRGYIRLTDRSGASQQIDLRYAFSASDVVNAINSATDVRVSAKLSGDRFVLTDNSGGSGTLSVGEVGGGVTAHDLGLAGISAAANSATGGDVVTLTRSTSLRTLLDGRGLNLGGTASSLNVTLKDGSTVSVNTSLKSSSASVGQLLDAINTAGGGKLQASINAAGDGLDLKDLTSGSGTFAATSPAGNLATALGWNGTEVSGTLSGSTLQSGLGDVLLSSLNGGQGLGTLGQLALRDRSGATATVNLSSAKTLGDVLATINAAGIGVTARLNDSKTGITLADSSGGSSVAVSATSGDATDTAVKLGFAAGSDPTRIDGTSLKRQWINENTSLKTWNQGKELTFSPFSVTNSAGKKTTITLTSSNSKTLGDAISIINNSGAGVTAKINEAGDGLLIVDSASGAGSLTVEDLGSGSTAKQLGIAGTGTGLSVGGGSVTGIDGSRNIKIATTSTTTVADLVTKINAIGSTAQANLINLGNGGVRLAITSSASGAAGRLTLNSSSLAVGFSETSSARDALVSVGGSGGAAGVLLSSNTDSFNSVVEGVSLTVNSTSTTAVTVEVKKNDESISKQLQSLVDQVNKVKDKLKELTTFDSGNFKTGLLFGSQEALRLDSGLSNLFGGRHSGNGSVRSLAELGISFNDQGKLTLDQTKLQAAIDRDPGAVQDFFTKEKTGFAAKAKTLVDSLTGIKSGSLLKRNEAIQSTIELNGKRLESMTLKLDRERTRLLNQFYDMESAISKSQNNYASIANVKPLTV